MSKIAIISDVHGNYVALEAILRNIEKKGVTEIYSLGDLVPKYSEPDKVLDAIRSNGIISVKGNGEYNVTTNPNYTYTWDKIGEDGIEYLKQLPIFHDLMISGKLVRLMHASPTDLERSYNPITDNKHHEYYSKDSKNVKDPRELFKVTDFSEAFKSENIGKIYLNREPDIVAFGHTHMPGIYTLGDKTLINPGSVGEPITAIKLDDGKFDVHLANEISYLLIDGQLNSKDLSDIDIEMVKIPYLELLKEIRTVVYMSGMATTNTMLKQIDNSIEKNKKI